jgi:hypothetical protein
MMPTTPRTQQHTQRTPKISLCPSPDTEKSSASIFGKFNVEILDT